MIGTIKYLALAAITAVLANKSSCGGDTPSKVDCENIDFGSCGNACCILDARLALTPEKAHEAVKAVLVAGGSDRSFGYRTGPNAAGINPGDDLRQYNMSYQYVFQGQHATTGGFIDILNFNIQSDGETGSLLRLFSVSDIHGALGDSGQNYKNLALLLSELDSSAGSAAFVHGCGKKH